LASLSSNSSVDGLGLRTVVWFQGCVHHCPGCHNPQTHDVHGGYEVEVEQLLNEIRALGNKKITFSGGDPFLQNLALYDLCEALYKENYTIWIYTGYLLEDLVKQPINQSILEFSDVLVDGKFIQDLKGVDNIFKGSSNQRVIKLRTYFKTLNVEESILAFNFME
jgi:anaerobic ribonucleoside-triphosphate reductase activating protein